MGSSVGSPPNKVTCFSRWVSGQWGRAGGEAIRAKETPGTMELVSSTGGEGVRRRQVIFLADGYSLPSPFEKF